VQAVLADLSRYRVVAYPDLRAAAGHITENAEPPAGETIWLPLDKSSPELFAVRVSGTSMDGGRQPIHDGDWAVLRVSRGQPASALENRVVLVQVHGGDSGEGYQIKRLRREGKRWLLTSDNPEGPTIEADNAMVVIARLEKVISPSDLAPPVGTVLTEPELSSWFGLDQFEARSGRHGGHLFIFVRERGQLAEPDRMRCGDVAPRPAETAFVLVTGPDATWRYLGVARRTDAYGLWAIPEVDYATWRAYGSGGTVSRRLPEEATAHAQLVVDELLDRPEPDRWLQRAEGGRARVVGAAPRGGIRIDGGPGGFAERTISLMDIAWVTVAAADVAGHGGVLDEARVNRVRYLEGVPKASTRWIDTGWAISAWRATRENARQP
jgi:hypothetical protein